MIECLQAYTNQNTHTNFNGYLAVESGFAFFWRVKEFSKRHRIRQIVFSNNCEASAVVGQKINL